MLQQCVNRELPDVQAGFRKGRGTRDQMTHWITENARKSRITSTSASLTTLKPFSLVYVDHIQTVWITTNCGKFLDLGISNLLTCLLRNLYASQEATVRIGYRTLDCSKLGKGYVKTVYCHPAYLTYMQSTS